MVWISGRKLRWMDGWMNGWNRYLTWWPSNIEVFSPPPGSQTSLTIEHFVVASPLHSDGGTAQGSIIINTHYFKPVWDLKARKLSSWLSTWAQLGPSQLITGIMGAWTFDGHDNVSTPHWSIMAQWCVARKYLCKIHQTVTRPDVSWSF